MEGIRGLPDAYGRRGRARRANDGHAEVKRRARRFIPRLVCRFLAREGRDARKRWRAGLRGGRAWLTIPITALSLYALWHWAFAVGPYFGTSFAIAAILAILRGHIFTHPFRIVLVAAAVVIATLFIRPLGEDAWQAFRRGDTLAATGLVGLIVVAWLLKSQLETGRVRMVGAGLFRRNRRRRRR